MILFPDISACCNCNGCTQICPKNAICKKVDDFGFEYPAIDSNKCIDCGLCQQVCAYQNIDEVNKPAEVFVAAAKDSDLKKKSASGGIFAIIAKKILRNNGIVYGAVLECVNGKVVIYHKGVESEKDLNLLQGSKYVQSDIRDCYKEIKKNLLAGKQVLFCGVPCQCAGLKGFLRKEYSNLYLVDIICHGVPSQQFFNDYISFKFNKFPNIRNFVFRDKSKGWELSARLDYGENKSKYIPAGTSSYYSLFLDTQIYRENCYSCKYASQYRAGDLTIGDYWGIQKEHPELIHEFQIKDGISCILVNNSRGKQLLSLIKDETDFHRSAFQKVANRNAQLYRPSTKSRFRDIILEIYRKNGYQSVEKFYRRHYLKQRLVHTILAMLPYRLKSFLRSLKN